MEEGPRDAEMPEPEVEPEGRGGPVSPRVRPARSTTRRWSGGGGLSRFATIGCALGLLAMGALLAVGLSLTKRTAWTAMDRYQRHLMAEVERRNQPGERLRTGRNLERFRVQLQLARDPYPVMGEFFAQVRAVLDDGVLTAEEVDRINLFLESGLPAAGDGGRVR